MKNGHSFPFELGSFSYSASYTFPNLIPFFSFSLQWSSVIGNVKIVVDGTTVSYIVDYDKTNHATITGTAIIEMQSGQKVSDSLLFYVA